MLSKMLSTNGSESVVQETKEQSKFDSKVFMEIFGIESEKDAIEFFEALNRAMERDIQSQKYH